MWKIDGIAAFKYEPFLLDLRIKNPKYVNYKLIFGLTLIV
jgi:hypothetical protein